MNLDTTIEWAIWIHHIIRIDFTFENIILEEINPEILKFGNRFIILEKDKQKVYQFTDLLRPHVLEIDVTFI